jgi:RNA polymerase sigma factor (sigma-70 family)
VGEFATDHDGAEDLRFELLYRRHHREVLAYFLRRVSAADAEDAAADVFSVAWRRRSDLPHKGSEAAWLFGVAHHVLFNHRRRLRRAFRLSARLAGLAVPAGDSPEHQVVRSSDETELLEALDAIRPMDAEVLRLTAWEGLSLQDIGEVLGISAAAAGQRVSRARKRLAAELARSRSRGQLFVSLHSKKEGGVR